MQTKICSKCSVEKPLEGFYKDKKAKDGRRADCKECTAERSKRYYNKNRDKVVQAIEEYRDGNQRYKEGRRAYRKRWYDELTPLERAIYNMSCGVHNRTGPNGKYTKKGIRNRLGNRAEIAAYLRECFSEDIQRLLDIGETPTIDRLDPDGHYEPSNIRIISHSKNSGLARRTMK